MGLIGSWVGSELESDGIVGVMTCVNPLDLVKACGRRFGDPLVSSVDSDSESV